MKDKKRDSMVAGLVAASMIGSQIPALASNQSTGNNYDYSNSESFDVKRVIESLYQKQMNSLVPVLEELKQFYEQVDTNNIIKTAYKNAYEMINMDLDYMMVSYGVSNYYQFIPNSQDYLKDIIRNNQLLGSLRIKPSGSSREPDYGIIPDENSQLGFRKKTDEDKKLIDEYTNILNKAEYVDPSLISLIVAVEQNEQIDDTLLTVLDSIYHNQNIYLNNVKTELTDFYENVDINNIIKEAYSSAYDAYNMPIDDTGLYENKDLNDYLNIISRNNLILSNLFIKTTSNARDTDYGVIIDKNSEYGFRIKTEEDKELLKKYSEIVGKNLNDLPIVNDELMQFLNYACTKVNTQGQTLR